MRKFTGLLFLALLSGAAWADTYQLTWGWTDPTTRCTAHLEDQYDD